MTSDEMNAMIQRLDRLAEHPIGGHPAVLDEVHRSLVGELERLAGVVSGDSRSRRSGQPGDDR